MYVLSDALTSGYEQRIPSPTQSMGGKYKAAPNNQYTARAELIKRRTADGSASYYKLWVENSNGDATVSRAHRTSADAMPIRDNPQAELIWSGDSQSVSLILSQEPVITLVLP